MTDTSSPVSHDLQQPDGVAAASDDPDEMEYEEALLNAKVWRSVFEDLGKALKPTDTILDFGSGTGKLVYAFRQLGYLVVRTDLVGPSAEVERRMRQEGLNVTGDMVFTVINRHAYRIPFESNCFEYVVSWHLMEHVTDHGKALSEISRVLKPGGSSLHFFYSRYRIVEPHIHVPSATLFQSYAYPYLWACTGIRTNSQIGLTAKEVAGKNHEYLGTETKCLTERELMQLVNRHFVNAQFAERSFWKYLGGKSGFIYKLLLDAGVPRLVPIAASVLRRFGYRALFFSKPP